MALLKTEKRIERNANVNNPFAVILPGFSCFVCVREPSTLNKHGVNANTTMNLIIYECFCRDMFVDAHFMISPSYFCHSSARIFVVASRAPNKHSVICCF